ncbi:MAG TPA: sugar ABC transporter permease [Thermodesulfobacteriota bacterium]|nr:sugar ABC transporter permease [Thermodesulfobacteriota bacterium]
MTTKGKPYLFLAPTLLILAVVTLYPLFYVFWLSLHRRLLIFDISKFIGLENYGFLLRDDRFWNALYNTVYFTAVSVFLELILGLAIAMLLNRGFKGKGIMRSIILVPWVIPTVVSAKMWGWMYNPDFGILNHLLGVNINWLGSPFWALNAAVFVDVWKTTPFVVLLLMARLQTIPVDLYRAARVDGASNWYIFRRITLPLLMPMILIVLIFRTLDAFRVFDVIYVLTGGGPGNTTETLSIYAYKTLFQTLQFGYGSALAVTIFLSVAITTTFYVKLLKRGTE